MFEKFIEKNNHNKIDDEYLANAYESIGDYYRSLIKTAIAFHFSHYKQPLFGEIFLESSQDGFEKYCITQKIKNILFYIDDTYNYPTKLLALLCQAIIAQPNNIVIFLDKNINEQTRTVILTCLELTGIEDSFFAPQNFYSEIQNLATNETKIIYCTNQTMNTHNQNIFIDNIPLSVIVPQSCKQEIELAYPKKDITYKEEPTYSNIKTQIHSKHTRIQHDISFCATYEALQNYSHGMEFCFLYSAINFDFFLNKIQYQILKLTFE